MSAPPRRRCAPGAVLLALLLALLGGCVSIPVQTQPVAVTEVPDSGQADTAAIESLAPQGGELPDEVVQRFLAASASTVRSRPVARLYLSAAANDTWADDAGVTVIDDLTAARPVDGLVTLTGSVLGGVDVRGVYLARAQPLNQVFSLIQEEGQWRITNPPPGVILRQSDFRRTFVQDNLYFLDPTGTRVVPDPRWFLAGAASRANTLVEELLQGPSQFLAPAVRNEFGPDVQLASNVLQTRDLEVNLTGLGERSPASLQALSAQLVWTLRQVSFSQLTIYDDRRVVAVPDVGITQASDDWQRYDPDFVSSEAVGHYVDQGAVWDVDGVRIPGPAGTGEYGLTRAGASADQRRLAGVRSAGGQQRLLVGDYGGALSEVLAATSLSTPTWAGPSTEVWTVRDRREVVRVPVGAPAQLVSSSGLRGRLIQAVAVSRDGTRAALVVGAPGNGELFVAGIHRAEGTAELTDLVRLATEVDDVVAVSWATATQVLLLAADSDGGRRRPWLASVDGAVLLPQPLNNLPVDPVAVASAPGRPALVAAGGTVYQLTGTTWSTLVPGQLVPAADPFYPS